MKKKIWAMSKDIRLETCIIPPLFILAAVLLLVFGLIFDWSIGVFLGPLLLLFLVPIQIGAIFFSPTFDMVTFTIEDISAKAVVRQLNKCKWSDLNSVGLYRFKTSLHYREVYLCLFFGDVTDDVLSQCRCSSYNEVSFSKLCLQKNVIAFVATPENVELLKQYSTIPIEDKTMIDFGEKIPPTQEDFDEILENSEEKNTENYLQHYDVQNDKK